MAFRRGGCGKGSSLRAPFLHRRTKVPKQSETRATLPDVEIATSVPPALGLLLNRNPGSEVSESLGQGHFTVLICSSVTMEIAEVLVDVLRKRIISHRANVLCSQEFFQKNINSRYIAAATATPCNAGR